MLNKNKSKIKNQKFKNLKKSLKFRGGTANRERKYEKSRKCISNRKKLYGGALIEKKSIPEPSQMPWNKRNIHICCKHNQNSPKCLSKPDFWIYVGNIKETQTTLPYCKNCAFRNDHLGAYSTKYIKKDWYWKPADSNFNYEPIGIPIFGELKNNSFINLPNKLTPCGRCILCWALRRPECNCSPIFNVESSPNQKMVAFMASLDSSTNRNIAHVVHDGLIGNGGIGPSVFSPALKVNPYETTRGISNEVLESAKVKNRKQPIPQSTSFSPLVLVSATPRLESTMPVNQMRTENNGCCVIS